MNGSMSKVMEYTREISGRWTNFLFNGELLEEVECF